VESDGTSGDRVSVAAHASVLPLKVRVFGFSMVEDRLHGIVVSSNIISSKVYKLTRLTSRSNPKRHDKLRVNDSMPCHNHAEE
jgi:hypothetical protein